MNLFSLFAFAVYAAETIISPIPDGTPVVVPQPPKPDISFGQLATAAPAMVLGETVEATPAGQSPLGGAPTLISTRKKSYTIALLGDSMIDTLGPDAPHLKNALVQQYAITASVLNYGVGGTNIDYGLERITNGYSYLGKQIPSLVSAHPDIVVVESFGYNPYPETNGVDRHWIALAKIVDSLRANLPGVKIIIAATIAPNSKTFGDGAPAIAFSPTDKIERTNVIKQYLGSTVKFAQSQHLPLADAYHASLDGSGDGMLTFINGGDHIHYSDAGRALFAQKVMEAIRTNHLLE